jgi:hypothetical protein
MPFVTGMASHVAKQGIQAPTRFFTKTKPVDEFFKSWKTWDDMSSENRYGLVTDSDDWSTVCFFTENLALLPLSFLISMTAHNT